MFISISKTKDRYHFIVGDEPNDNSGAMFNSLEDYHYISDFPSSFTTFAEAHAHALWLSENRPSIILAKKSSYYKFAKEMQDRLLSPESMIIQNYNDQFDLIHQRVIDLESKEGKDFQESIELTIKELDGFKSELENILDILEDEENIKNISDLLNETENMIHEIKIKKNKLTKHSSLNKFYTSFSKDVIRTLSTKAAIAISNLHDQIFVKKAHFITDNKIYHVILSEYNNGKISDVLHLNFDKDYLLEDILPSSSLYKECSYHSEKFLEKYWEPIVNAVGHIKQDGNVFVPSFNTYNRLILHGFDKNSGEKVATKICSKMDNKYGTWWLKNVKTSTSKFKSEDLIEGVEVVCIRPDLETYYNRTGTIVNRHEHRDFVDLIIDFRRGIGEVVLTDKDVEIVSLPA